MSSMENNDTRRNFRLQQPFQDNRSNLEIISEACNTITILNCQWRQLYRRCEVALSLGDKGGKRRALHSTIQRIARDMQEWAEYSRVWAFCTQETIFRTLERFNEDLDNLGVPAAGEESRQIALAEDRAALNRTLCYIVTSFKDMREIFSLDPADIHYFVDAIQHAMRNEQAQSPIYNRFQDAFLAFRTAITRVDSAPDLSSLIEKLGENPVKRDTFSDIYEGELLGQEKVALATFRVTKPPDPQTWQRFHREILMWTNLQHENVLEIYGLQGDMCLVLPWVPVDAHAYLESNPQVNPHSLLLGAAAGLEYLHAHQPPIIHGDIRGANILVSESGAAQITGYGVVPFMVGASMDKSIDHLIAARWTAPELITPLENEESNGETPAIDTWTQASDVWSFGMTILELLSGKIPYHNRQNVASVIFDICRGILPTRPVTGITDQMWALIHRCWDVNSHQRISASQLVIEMNGLYSSGGSSVLLLSPVRPESPAHSPTLTFGPATPLSGDFLFAGSPDEDTFTSPIPERFSYSSFASSDGIYSSPIGSSRLLPSGPSSVSATDLPRSSPSNNSIPPNSERRRSLTLNKVRSIRSIFGHTRSATEPPSSPPPQRAPSRASSYSSGSRPGTGKVAPVQILTTPMKVGSEIPAEWVGVSGMERLRQLTPRQVRRESALQHLIDKEKSFVAQDLDNVVTTRLRDQKSPISPAERAESFLRQVFQRRVAITDAHRGFLVELNDRQLEHNGLAQIGGICLNAIVKLAQLYPEFQESLYMSEGLIDHEAKQNPAFARFLDQEVSMARGSGPATLKNFLRLPLAHIREETELIQLILAETPRDHPDVQSLQKVAQTLVGVINTSQLREWQASAGIRAAAAHSMLWRDLIYKGVAHEALSVEEIARQSAIFDLIKLEMEYVHDLQLAHTLFIIPLRKAAPSTLTADLLQALEDDVFPLHEVAWDLHHSLLLSLHLLQRHEHPTIRSVSASLSDILILRRERYVTRYSTHLPRAITLLDEVEDTQAFRGLPDLMSRNIHVNQQDLRDIFRRPSLHLHCLERSVREILVHTPKGHEDEILLPRVIHTIQDLARACVSNAQDTKESVLARFSSNLIWKDGIEVDINLQDKERRIITSGYLDLVVELEQGLQRRTGVTMTLLDNYVVVTEQVEKQGITSDRVTLQPIPIELVDLTFWDREVAITQREERFPSFPFTIRRQGRTPQEFHTFVTKSETDRSQWYQALQSTLRSRLVYTSDTKSYQTKLLRQDLLTNRTNSFMRGATNSAIFEYQGSQYCVVAGAGPPAGLWIWPRQRLRSPYVMPLDNVTQCAVLHKLGLLLVLTDKRLLAYHLYDVTFAQVVDGNRITPPSHKVDPTNPIVRFFRIGTHNGSPLLVLSTTRKQRANVFRVLEPSLGNPTKAKSISFFASKGGLFQLQGEFALDGPPAHDAKFLKTSLAIFGASGFQIVNITDLRNARGTIIPLCDQGAHAFGELSKRCCSSHATGIARIGDEFLLCYPDFGVYIDLQGHIRRGPIPWESTNIQTLLLHDQFIVLVSPQVVEVRLALSGKLVQLITGVGIRCLLSCEDGAKDDPIHLAMDRLSEEGRSRPGLGVSEAIFELLPSTS